MRIKIFMLLVVFLVSVASLSCSRKMISEEKFNVVKVFMHEEDHYSFYVESGNNELVHRDFGKYDTGVIRIFKDMPKDKKMWVKATKNSDWDNSTKYDLEIHIHSESDIEGGGWNHGKFGKGQTSVVE